MLTRVGVCVMLMAVAVGAKAQETALAIFAGGCFWCMEKPFDEVDGVSKTVSGYIGGQRANPTYEQVSAGVTGHAEAVQITYDPAKVNYEALLAIFWRNIDPLDAKGQFCDKGSQYRSAIFYRNEQELALAQQTKAQVSKTLGAPVATTLEAATEFYPAEDYHQDYYLRNPLRYKYYRHGCGRDKRLEALWGEGR
ncbi:peptide-methionine (S)-S-oxide reductase MsrA [Simiduia curdlanivorans]|uniref:Peptide methionine sulfoxide reductase MsrA n=1 Tax=Simiduia curdlanivorans TaxID=1492769 RepID=A0ABV8V3Z2_9GAMM|nr:peptide-methionine (S)-S-oxide reductase MsrA [Simiduia curdlanivorans]MDN3640842.1 peptide-methionine (S)-S-oxide reductase MsrA [Simiduia curdlanivorans]